MKYENIDLLDALQKIMDIHTEHYKEDFELDQKLIRSLAATQSFEDKHLLWMSRPHGTHVMREREIYIEDTYENKAWEFYHDQTSDDILAYSIEITGTENGSVVGNLIELDYDAHVERMKQLTVTIDKVAVTFEDQNTYYLLFQSYRREMKAMQEEHGKVKSVAYLPESERELQMILRRERLKTSYHTESGDIKLPVCQKIEYRSAKEHWKRLGASPKQYNCNYPIPKSEKTKDFFKAFNLMSDDIVSETDIIKSANSVPQFEATRLCKIVTEEMKAQQKHGAPKDEKELQRQFREISRIALRNGILPSALYLHVIMGYAITDPLTAAEYLMPVQLEGEIGGIAVKGYRKQLLNELAHN